MCRPGHSLLLHFSPETQEPMFWGPIPSQSIRNFRAKWAAVATPPRYFCNESDRVEVSHGEVLSCDKLRQAAMAIPPIRQCCRIASQISQVDLDRFRMHLWTWLKWRTCDFTTCTVAAKMTRRLLPKGECTSMSDRITSCPSTKDQPATAKEIIPQKHMIRWYLPT